MHLGFIFCTLVGLIIVYLKKKIPIFLKLSNIIIDFFKRRVLQYLLLLVKMEEYDYSNGHD
jgi:hypothetical protein